MARDTTLRIPLAFMAVVGFVIGLLASIWVSGILGFPPALFWAVLVLLFLTGVYFLEHPKQFLVVMFLYYGLMANGILLGFYPLPVPMVGMLDEIILAVPLAIIVMKAVHRQLPKRATLFPLLYVSLAVLSWRINHVPTMNAIRATLTYGKFYIFWYYTRAIGPWSDREKRRWFAMLVLFALAQFFINIYWQKGLGLRFHPDNSTGTVGNAHYVGYLSVMILFMIVGWFGSKRRPLPLRRMSLAAGAALLIAYNLIFLTDTKHALFFVPFAAIPFFFYPKYPARLRIGLGATMLLFGLASWSYMAMIGVSEIKASSVWRSVKYSGKGEMVRTLLFRLPEEVPLAVLGAGPGNFCSAVGLLSFRPLANKYVLPYVIQAHRTGGFRADSSAVGKPQSSLFTLWGEFGPLSGLIYFAFWAFVIRSLWRDSIRRPPGDFDAGQQLAIIAGLVVIIMAGMLVEAFYIGVLMLPLWSLAGMFWPEPPPPPAPEPSLTPTLEDRRARRGFISYSGRV
ncbi:MAG: hypothetical protein KA248_09635 [Kiritimatiellae bacterium]|nr:hypothetical protein [Kiritimatiellia bacterium]